MRLLNIETLQFREFPGYDDIPPYLITSHRWSTEEATFKDVLKGKNKESEGYGKIQKFCAFSQTLKARREPVKWIWLDTCCIDQRSSAEVSESINSMWRWYSGASHCIAYLRDVRPLRAGWEAVMFDFQESEWFERGWTLQELLAPRCVIFVTKEWEVIGRKSTPDHRCSITANLLHPKISEVTGIPADVLCSFESHRDSVPPEVKLAWAANRKTTKAEDCAYSLLGIFDVHLPLIYGEGARNARKRLTQEIANRNQELELREQFGFEAAGVPLLPNHQTAEVGSVSGQTSRARSLIHAPADNRNEPTPTPEDTCPLCHCLLQEPLTTSCGHTICEHCLIPDPSVDLAIVPLQSSGKAEGSAASSNFKRLTKCPVCNTAEMDNLIALPNPTLTKRLQLRYPRRYAQRTAQLDGETDANSQYITIQIGNYHRELRKNQHDWSFFVRPSRTDIIKEVQLELHESFSEAHVVCSHPPYSFTGQGWGFFTIQVVVVLQAGYSWVSRNATNEPGAAPRSALKMEWTLDFDSFEGRGAMGKCRVKVQRAAGVR